MMKISEVWEILERFRKCCKQRKWNTSENEDWIGVDDNYHSFLCAREVHPSSFKRIAAKKKCVVREGLSYRVVEAEYAAWLFSKAPSDDIVKTIREDPELAGRIAVYDFSPLTSGRMNCVKLNNTDSVVFREFESFLKSEIGIVAEPLPSALPSDVKTEDCTIAGVI